MLNNKILIIDDESAVRKTISSALKNAGYELLFAENGKEGLELYQEHHPLLIILDLKMPIMDGVEFLETIKLAPADPCSVIVLTGHGRDEDVEKCFDLGVSSFLRKPFNFYEFNGLVRHSITLKKNEEELKKHRDHLEKLVNERTHELEMARAINENIIHAMFDALMVLTPKGVIQKVNESFCNLLGYEEKELIGKPVNKIIVSEVFSKEISMDGLIEEFFVSNAEKIFIDKDGRKVFSHFSGSVMNDELGEIIGIVCVARDITARKRLEPKHR